MKLKKIASLMLAGVMAVSMLTACGNNGADDKGEGEGETSNASSYSTELRAAMVGDAMRNVTAVADAKLDAALQSAVDKYFTITDFTTIGGALQTGLVDQLDTAIGKDLVKAMDAKTNIGNDLNNKNTKTTVVVKLYAVEASTGDIYALEKVADEIEGKIAALKDKSAEDGGSKYDYDYTIAASIVTKPVTSSLVQGVETGVKYIAVAVTQNVTKIV
ncbi:hypothetical protein B5G28_09970 [Faecalibacterium sp. An77]|uniref:hypothetical protein n=1 Tax=Faecalibacterium sp. An77 TaxID=1965655 RepID=UPI000B3A892C|nr:hypothetical protein [Faecalibacterium sp. An77]OUN37895.1 hypothetical protein B5G28_09970 [Faecalibacterium sp. An77]